MSPPPKFVRLHHGAGSQLLLLLAFLTVFARTRESSAADVELVEFLKSVAAAQQANQASFARGWCQYRCRWFSARTQDEARQGIAIPTLPQDEILLNWYWDDDRMVVGTVVEDPGTIKPTGNGGLLFVQQIAGNGSFALEVLGASGTIKRTGIQTLNIHCHPFNLGCDSSRVSFARSVELSLQRDFQGDVYVVDKAHVRDGKEYIRIERSSPDSSSIGILYCDPQRHFMPVIQERVSPRDGTVRALYEVAKTEKRGDAYFPMVTRFLGAPRKQEDGTTVVQSRLLEVTQLDTTYRPSAEDFTIQVSPDVQYSDGVNPNTAKTLYGDRNDKFVEITVDQIPLLDAALQQIARERAIDQLGRGR